jgi:hypothetical protein
MEINLLLGGFKKKGPHARHIFMGLPRPNKSLLKGSAYCWREGWFDVRPANHKITLIGCGRSSLKRMSLRQRVCNPDKPDRKTTFIER